MSQTPEVEPDAQAISSEEPYLQAIVKINDMIHMGASLSGNERNCCFLNTGDARFANASAITGLDFADDGRAVASVDWDLDGDLDLWCTNRNGPRIRFLQNENSGENGFVTIRLTGRECNRDAIGATVEMTLKDGRRIFRSVRAGQGFLSQSSMTLHFGIADEQAVDRFVVRWPGGQSSTHFGIETGKHYTLSQGGRPVEWQPPLAKTKLSSNGESETSNAPRTAADSKSLRVILPSGVKIPAMPYVENGQERTLEGPRETPLLVNLWASWCQPCIRELNEFRMNADKLRDAGLDLLILNVDELDSTSRKGDTAIPDSETPNSQVEIPFPNGRATTEMVSKLQIVHDSLIRHGSLPVPTSLLIDRQGKLKAIYKGTVDITQVIEDARTAQGSANQSLAEALPFAGTWHGKPPSFRYAQLVQMMIDGGFARDAKHYLSTMRSALANDPDYATLLVRIGNEYFKEREFAEAELLYREALKVQPRLAVGWFDLGLTAQMQRKHDVAIESYRKAIELDPKRAEALLNLGVLLARRSELKESLEYLDRAVVARTDFAIAFYHRGRVLEAQENLTDALGSYRKSFQLDPTHVPTMLPLARLLEQTGEVEQARSMYERYVLARPRNPEARVHLAVLLESDNPMAAIEHYRQSLKLQPTNLSAQNNLAWLLATSPDGSIRDIPESLRLGKQAAEATKHQRPEILDTLAAAYANAAQFENAVMTAQRAIDLAAKYGLEELKAQISERLQLYQNSKPYRTPK